jgi:hypothetical protein
VTPLRLGLCALAVLFFLGAGCRRKLPGPEECQRLSARILGVEDARVLRDPTVKQRFDDLTVRCLTTPFDREFVRCLDESPDARQCLYRFQNRRARGTAEQSPGPVRRW